MMKHVIGWGLVGVVFWGVQDGRVFGETAIANQVLRIEVIFRDERAVGVSLQSAGKPVANSFFGPNGLWRAQNLQANRQSLRFTGFDTSRTGGTPFFSADSFIEIALTGASRFPVLTFALNLEEFDPAAWEAALPPRAPFYFLPCQVPGAAMFYRGGGLIPTPAFNPYPLSVQGKMSGNWSKQWSFAATMEAFAVPALGLWNPAAGLFVGYDFGTARHTDRSSKYLSSAYCAGEGQHAGDMFCLVYPHAGNWVDLKYPEGPVRLASHFEVIYSTDLSSDKDPNQFVLQRFVRDHRDLLRPAPAMNDLTWIRDPGRVQLPHAIVPNAGHRLFHHSGPHYLEGAFCELDTLMLGTTYPGDAVRAIYNAGNTRAITALEKDIEFLKNRAAWKTIQGQRCCVWVHPLEGKFKERWGGEQCAGFHHKSTWQIGTAMLVVYAHEKDSSLLPFIDGVFNWTRHALYTRNGVCDIPWAMFCHMGLAAGENFMLTYRQTFREDPARARNLDEALRLASMVAYKSTWFYLADPNETDGMDPMFLGQAVVDRRWIGRVTWNECGWPPRTAIPLYCETGDPFFKYFVRGVAANFFVGYRSDGGITENVNISGETEPKGRRTAGTSGISNGAQLRRWAEPASDSPVRICVGEKAAIAFCKNTFDYDVADYAYRPELNFKFRLTARPGAPKTPIDVTLTAVLRDLRTRPIRINGQALGPDRIEYNPLTGGEDAYLRQVRPGDLIEVGNAEGAVPAPPDPMPYRSIEDARSRTFGPFQTVDLSSAVNEKLEMRFGEKDSWYGWLYGLRWRERVPYYFLDPALTRGRACVKGSTARPVRIRLAPADRVFVVFGILKSSDSPAPATIGRIRLLSADGAQKEVAVTPTFRVDVNCSLPIRTFDAYGAILSLPGGTQNSALEVLAGRLFAVTTLSGDDRLAAELKDVFRMKAEKNEEKAGITRYPVARRRYPVPLPWRAPSASTRLVIEVTAEQERTLPVIRLPLDLATLAAQVGAPAIPDASVTRCLDISSQSEVPAQFDEFSGGRGTITILPDAPLLPAETRRFELYFHSSKPSAPPPLTSSDQVAVLGGTPSRVRAEFDLAADSTGPRLTDLRFDLDGDGQFEEPNVLGQTGFSGGFGSLTAVVDPYFWFNFSQWQKEPSRARILFRGPASTTVAIENIHLFGLGGAESFTMTSGRWKGKEFSVGRKGIARWYFRTYTGRPYLDQWVEWNMEDGDTGWTRVLQIRYGLANYDPSAPRTGGRPGEAAVAKDFLIIPMPEEPGRIPPNVVRSRDGHVMEVSLARGLLPGLYATNPWRTAPSTLGADQLILSSAPITAEVFASEQMAREKRASADPKNMEGGLVTTLHAPSLDDGPASPLPGTLNLDSSFEKTKQYWHISNDASWSGRAARTGKIGAVLEVNPEKEKTLALVQTGRRTNQEMALEPNRVYQLTCWAKCLSEKGKILTNLYGGRRPYDFDQVHVPLVPDGKWHQYQVELRTRGFPLIEDRGVFQRGQRLFPSLRLWCLGTPQLVYLDDVCLTPSESTK